MNDIHHSLYDDLARDLANVHEPPAVPIFDHHMHAGDVTPTRAYVKAAKSYGVEKALALAGLDQSRALKREFGDFFLFCGWPYLFDIDENPNWLDERLREIHAEAEAGYVGLKFKIVPDREGRAPVVWLDDKRVKPLFDAAGKLGLSVQAHIAQPDVWFERHFDTRMTGEKRDYFRQVEHILKEHPGITYVGVHMGGYPEDLDYLQELMDTYPNFNLDTSATKWSVRELSRQHEKAREFFIRNADRIFFGSDLVVQRSVSPTYYTSRFHVQRQMWEGSKPVRSMIKDPDSDTTPMIVPLDLPPEVLRKIYWENGARLFGF